MTKETLRSLIHQLHTEMKELTLEAGIPEKKYNKVLVCLHSEDVDKLLNMENWLREARDGVYAKALEVKKRHPQELWTRYKNLGLTSLNEVVLLGKKLKELRAFWRNPYNVKLEKNQKHSKPVQPKAESK